LQAKDAMSANAVGSVASPTIQSMTGSVASPYPAGTVVRPATIVSGAPQVITAPGQYITAPAQYVTPKAPQQKLISTAGRVITTAASSVAAPPAPVATTTVSAPAGADVAAGTMMSRGGVITAPAQYVTPQGGYMQVKTGSMVAPAPVVIRQGAPTTLTGSVVRMANPTPTQVAGTAQPRPHTLAGPDYTQGAYESKHQDDPQLQNLKELRKTSGLKHIPVGVGLATLKGAADDGKLERDAFLQTYNKLLSDHGIAAPDDSVQHAVFDLFDRDENNIVDMMELICGISLLCEGSEEDKIHAVFNVFDENGDGFISMDEMFKFLTSVFKVVLTPNVMGVMNSMGVIVESAEDLASVTSLECFKTADLNHDGKLSVTEFKNWFYAPRNDPAFLFSPVRKLLQ
jgi:Ca2+-binding EF-hand superfamily protein